MSAPVEARAFDVCGRLPTGITVLEASAGTGKTYTIAALAARHVAEGTPLDRILLVTFTRMATGELRERVRERLVAVERGLSGALDGGAAPSQDEIVELLARGDEAQVRTRRDRLRQALAGFDGATITTTHGFCQEVLGGLGIAGDLEPGTAFVEDISDLVSEVVDDLYVRRFHVGGDPPRFDRAQAGKVADTAVRNPTAPIAEARGEEAQMRIRLARAVRDELEKRKRRLAVMTYDDLLTRLDAALTGEGGPAAVARLRTRFAVVLVDEFQDTDPVQWDVVRRAFGGAETTLVLIGDPKQAIYAFRGADVYAYLEAARTAGAGSTLDVNWRSDRGLIDAYDALFRGAQLGHEGIVYRRVRAAPANREPRLTGAPCPAPLRIRVAGRDVPAVGTTPTGFARSAPVREHIARDLAADLVALLSSPAEIERRDDDGTPLERERVRPGHVAVLVRTNRSAALIRDALDAVRIPAVINGAGSVFATAQAREWLRLLEAIERPTSPARARSAALTCFLGFSPEAIAAADERAWEQVHGRLHEWARVLRTGGVASLAETITLTERLPERILAATDGERRLTDLRHVAQLLHAAAAAEGLGATTLAAWLRRRIAEAEQDTSDEERSRRLESDAEAVQVLTIHRSKGLEFPVVHLPFLWEPGWAAREAEPVFFHDPEAGDARTIDVSLEGAAYERNRRRGLEEQRGEDLRLAYVALTRARHQAVVWWAGSWDSCHSALSRLVFDRADDGSVPAAGSAVPADAAALARFQELADEAPGAIAVERAVPAGSETWSGPSADAVWLEAAVFDRGLDLRWRRTSYSDLSAGAREAHVSSEPEQGEVSDEEVAPVTAAPQDEPLDGELGTASLLAQAPVGVRFGTLVHRVLEATDFAAADLEGELAGQLAAAQARRGLDVGDPAELVTGLRAAIETPLGPLLGGARLRDFTRADRLDELEFELPLAGGDDPSGQVALTSLGAVLAQHLDADDPLAGYAARLDDSALRPHVRGYLTGSLDLVVRTAAVDGSPRFAVIDYKTNWLAPPGAGLTAWHHRPSALAAEMRRAHYGLQAILYTAALHRYLRWRLPGYDPERNLAGVLYLFLRGMSGADTPTVEGTPCGVFAWRAPRPLVEALSDVLDGEAAA